MKQKALIALAATAVLVALDLWTKHLMSTEFVRGETKEVIPGFFQLTLVHNTGAAFGLGRDFSMAFFLATSLVAIGVVIYLFFRLRPAETLSRIGLVLILGGALGNSVDRIRFGYVVDFLYFHIGRHFWPAFNVADSCITVGACLFALDLVLHPRKKAGHEASSV